MVRCGGQILGGKVSHYSLKITVPVSSCLPMHFVWFSCMFSLPVCFLVLFTCALFCPVYLCFVLFACVFCPGYLCVLPCLPACSVYLCVLSCLPVCFVLFTCMLWSAVSLGCMVLQFCPVYLHVLSCLPVCFVLIVYLHVLFTCVFYLFTCMFCPVYLCIVICCLCMLQGTAVPSWGMVAHIPGPRQPDPHHDPPIRPRHPQVSGERRTPAAHQSHLLLIVGDEGRCCWVMGWQRAKWLVGTVDRFGVSSDPRDKQKAGNVVELLWASGWNSLPRVDILRWSGLGSWGVAICRSGAGMLRSPW